MKLSEILSGPETWCKGVHVSKDGRRMCIQGAALMLDFKRDYHNSSLKRLVRLLGTVKIAEWNDAPERTWDEIATVVEAFDRDRLLNP